MFKAISTVNVPVLGIHVGDTIACATRKTALDGYLLAHSGYTFYGECRYVQCDDASADVFAAIDEAFTAGLELDYANINFSAFMKIFDARTIGDVNRAMSACRAMI